MKRIQEWLLLSIQLIVKMGFLGKYELVSVPLEQTKTNKSGLKILEKTIISLGKKNDTLNETITSAKYEIATLEKDILGLQGKLEYVTSKNTEAENKLSAMTIERGNLEKEIEDWIIRDSAWADSLQREKVSFQEEITSLNSTLEEATTLSEKLQGEMKKWRT